jgi:hypothetical protein
MRKIERRLVSPGSRLFSDLLDEIRKKIYKICMGFNLNKAVDLYEKLYDGLRRENIYQAKFNTDNLERHDCDVTKKVFTTNYDTAFETFLRTKKKIYSDGFVPQDQEYIFGCKWDVENIQLAKLHGSINYYSMNGKVVRYSTPVNEYEHDVFGDKIKQRMMILPIGEKYVTTTPFLEMLYKLRTDLNNEEIVVVIGFSFQDDPINNAFRERIARRDLRFKIVVVDPNAEQIIRHNLPREFQNVCIPVRACFGSDQSIDDLVYAIKERRCDDGF